MDWSSSRGTSLLGRLLERGPNVRRYHLDAAGVGTTFLGPGRRLAGDDSSGYLQLLGEQLFRGSGGGRWWGPGARNIAANQAFSARPSRIAYGTRVRSPR